MGNIRTEGCILLAFDGSAHSMKALDEAMRIAKALNVKLLVLHVYWGEAADVNSDPKRIAIEDVDLEAQMMFGKLEKILKENGVEYELRSELNADVPFAITEIADKENSEMIIIGNRGVGSIRDFLLGSVAEKVTSISKRSVLIVK